MASPHLGQRCFDSIGGEGPGVQESREFGVTLAAQCEQQVLGGNEIVSHAGGLSLCVGEDLPQVPGHRELGTVGARELVELALEFGCQGPGLDLEALQQGRSHPLGLGQQGRGEVEGSELGMASGLGSILGILERGLGSIGVLGVHARYPSKRHAEPLQAQKTVLGAIEAAKMAPIIAKMAV